MIRAWPRSRGPTPSTSPTTPTTSRARHCCITSLRRLATPSHWRGDAIMVSKPRQEALGAPLPEQDLWRLAEAVALRIKQIRSWERGVVSIEDAMQRGKLRSARWHEASGKPEPELLLPEFWEAHLMVFGHGGEF